MITEFIDTATPTMPLPHLDLPLIRSKWISEDGRELTDLTDPPIAGIRVGLWDADDVEIAQTTTDPAGSYRFDDVPPGDYTVVFTAPSGVSGISGRIKAGNRRPATRWPGDSVVPTPVHLWLSLTPSLFQLLGTLA